MYEMKTVLVTGGVRGIGRAISLLFLKKGYRVCAVYSRDEESAKKIAAEGVETYTLHYGEKGIYTTEKRPAGEAFSYLTLMMTSLDQVTASLYDSNGLKLMDVRFDTQTQELVTLPVEK